MSVHPAHKSTACLWGSWGTVSEMSEILNEVQVGNTHCSSLIHQVGHFIREAHHIVWAWLPHGESILTTPDDLLALRVPGNGFQDLLLHHLPKDQGKAVWPLILSSFLPFLKIALAFILLQSSGPAPSYHDWSGIINSYAMTSTSSLSIHACIPVRRMDIFMSSLLKHYLTFSTNGVSSFH